MKRIVLTAVALLAASPAAAVVTTSVGANGGFATTPAAQYSSITYFNQFSSAADTTRFSTAPLLTSGSVGGQYQAPLNDSTQYAVVSPSAGSTPTTFSTAGLVFNQISLYWGSIDSFNTLTFLGAGGAVIPGASFSGSQFAASNSESRYVTFTFDAVTAASITGIRFASPDAGTVSGNAFEFDNLIIGTAAAVPEASTWAMMVVGLGLVGGTMRRRAKTTVKTLAAA